MTRDCLPDMLQFFLSRALSQGTQSKFTWRTSLKRSFVFCISNNNSKVGAIYFPHSVWWWAITYLNNNSQRKVTSFFSKGPHSCLYTFHYNTVCICMIHSRESNVLSITSLFISACLCLCQPLKLKPGLIKNTKSCWKYVSLLFHFFLTDETKPRIKRLLVIDLENVGQSVGIFPAIRV